MTAILVVHHTVSPALHESLEVVVAGVQDAATEIGSALDVRSKPALSATVLDVLEADALILGTPANIGYMSGALKHFFDQIYYPVIAETRSLPYGCYVHGNNDCAGAIRAIEKIASGLAWRAVADPVTLTGGHTADSREALNNLGAVVAATALGAA